MQDSEVEEVLSTATDNGFGYFDCILPKCRERFVNFYNLRMHVYLDHLGREEFSYECTLCGKKYNTKPDCDQHENKHIRCYEPAIMSHKEMNGDGNEDENQAEETSYVEDTDSDDECGDDGDGENGENAEMEKVDQ